MGVVWRFIKKLQRSQSEKQAAADMDAKLTAKYEMAQGREREYDPPCNQECVALANLRGEVNALTASVNDFHHAMNGNGNPGFIRETKIFQERALAFFTASEATEVEREKQLNKRDQEIKDALADHYALIAARDSRKMWILTAVGLIIAVAMLYVAIHESKQKISDLIPQPGVSYSQPKTPQIATEY